MKIKNILSNYARYCKVNFTYKHIIEMLKTNDKGGEKQV